MPMLIGKPASGPGADLIVLSDADVLESRFSLLDLAMMLCPYSGCDGVILPPSCLPGKQIISMASIKRVD
ncbi:MAG: hypothetical protein EBT59_15385 [Betaproteobacteria bacterium]|nr:hypothetical protein [Betaproteobacteria bacterium]NCX04029.1 hypothetical protein [Betaproteobacteria bacterium]